MNRTWSPFEAPVETHTSQVTDKLQFDVHHRQKKPQVTSSQKRNGRAETPSLDQIKTVTMSFRNMHEYGGLLVKYLEARKSVFLDDLCWNVSETDGMEFDQYDTPFARWIVLHQFGEILGGLRMLPTIGSCGIYSYMLRDAQQGLLEDLPTDVLFFKAPVEHNVWEATRFFIMESVPAQSRQHIQTLLFRAMSQTAMENGASHVIGIVPAIWARWARRLGVNATPIGARFSIDGTSSQSVLFQARDYLI